MKIFLKESNLKFEDLAEGDVFKTDLQIIYMKTITEGDLNTVRLSDGALTHHPYNLPVHRVSGAFVSTEGDPT